ncbi:SDR family oxidoreductase [Streptomyces sp. NPDC090306]|uniref:SDR family oxidoreductase n=1 Tax=Streptomyces sp. NPDC090306 TaxID=3365961 RepID=UPI00382C9B3F
MATVKVNTDVVVVGAGPVGLLLAGELRLGGARVVVLETRGAPTTESRASTLHARTMQLLASRDLLGRLGDIPHEPRGHFAGIPLDLTLPTAYPGQWKVLQSRTEELLQEWAVELGADLRRGHTLRRLAQDADGVEAEALTPGGPAVFHARHLVACDGEDSTVRALTRADFPGTDAGRLLLRADVAGIDVPGRRFERLAGGLAIAARRPDGVTRVMVHEFSGGQDPGGEVSFEDVVATWRRVTGEDISHGTPLWVNSFGDAARQVAHYRDGRVLFAGDAAHRQMPIGGQALNLGLHDAFNLGWKLAARVTGRAPDTLLDTYDEERRPAGARTLTNISAQANLLLGGPEVEAARSVLTELVAHEPVRRHLAAMIAAVDLPESADALCGTVLPDVPLDTPAGPVTAARLLSAGRGLLLTLTGAADTARSLRRTAAPWAAAVDVVAAGLPPDAEDGTGGARLLSEARAVLVRPDGHIAWAGPDAADLPDALARWFGPPADATPATDTRPRSRRRTTMDRLHGRTALVTGASRGMGRATALKLALDGALVAVHHNTNADAARETVETIEKDGGRAFAVRAELGVPGDVHTLFLALEEQLKERTGTTDLDILVNNAGVMGGTKPEDTTPEAFDRLVAVNAKAPFFVIQRALENMPDGGRIINISSGLTRFANPDEIAYAMTKGAVEQLALHYAKLLGPRRITVNSVAPGITRNDNPVFGIPEAVEQMAGLSAFNRVGEPEDVADVVAFLASDEARWITGSFVDASGGTLLG